MWALSPLACQDTVKNRKNSLPGKIEAVLWMDGGDGYTALLLNVLNALNCTNKTH